MLSKKYVSAIAITAFFLLSSVTVFVSQKASATSWLTTSDTDFSNGNFNQGTGWDTELHGTGVDAYVQNTKDMTNWIQKFPGTNTGGRTQFGFTNDSAESRFILFGGIDGISQWRNDTWEYNYAAENWERICSDDTPACGPPKRSSPSMAYDNNSKVAVLYGGIDENALPLSDTWEYDVTTNTWTNRTPPTSPRGMGAHKMVYDANDKRVILVGRGSSAMEVWEYNAAAHTWTNRNPSGGPSYRFGYALGYSYQANHQRVVLYGGSEMIDPLDDTWEYNYASNSWSQVNPVDRPSARTGTSMTYNFKQSMEGIILWGGNSWSTETWRYYWDGSTPTWIQVTTTTAPIPGRQNHGLSYDPAYNALIIYGGEPFSGPRLNDTWFLEAGYRLGGKYDTKYFNTGDSNTDWLKIFWNQTPATVPPQTEIRFQVQASNTCDDAEPKTWRGPGGSTGQYYLTPGQDLWTGLKGNKCLRWQALMITNDPATAPRLEDVTIIYNVTGAVLPPTVVSYSPKLTGNPLDAPIHINFSKSMNVGNVYVSIVPNITFDMPWEWKSLNSQLTLWHYGDLFKEITRYDVCVWATDTLGLNLSGGKFCMPPFTTRGSMPYITNTNPAANAVDVPLTAPVVITFNEPMNTSTCWPYVTIDPKLPPTLSFDGYAWSAGDTVLSMTHSVDFAQYKTFTVDIPIGDSLKPCKDKSGLLLTVGPTAVPWSFRTLAINPFIDSTDPLHLWPDVTTTLSIKIVFSRDMDTTKFYYAFKDWDPATEWWKNWTGTFSAPSWTGLRTVTLAHSTPFGSCKPYRMQVWALDTTGKSLIDNPMSPNPWKFMTGANCAPWMIVTNPEYGEQEVPTWKNISIAWFFSPPDTGGMTPSSFTFSVKDQYGNDLTGNFNPVWSGQSNAVVELQHAGFPFDPCQEYTVRVLTARDTSNRPFIPGTAENPFKFKTTTTNCPPIVIWTQPTYGRTDVPVDTDLKFKFDRPMNPATLIVIPRPTITLNAPVWTPDDSNVTISHEAFTPCTWYNISVEAADLNGTLLGRGPIPLPLYFRAFCPPTGTYITDTNPANGQTGIPLTASIWINFSDPMDTNSLTFTLTPAAGSTTQTWSNGDMTVRIDHSSPYIECDLYQARVVSARNKSGGALVGGGVPNPWTFRAQCIAPYIVSTIPVNNAVNVGLGDSIQIIFSEPMDSTSLLFGTNPPLTYVASWPNGQTVVLSHTAPFTLCTDYTATVTRARDLDNVDLVPGPVPNPWTFTTDCRFQIKGLQVHRMAPDVQLTWTPDPAVLYWNVYHSNDRLAPWPWTMIANLSAGTSSYVHSNAIGDMQDHFYIVQGFKPGGWSSNSTMGALWHESFSPNVGRPSAYWFSLPYNSIYKKAKDISDELTGAKINVVAKFDATRQQTIIWYYIHGAWRGTNFNINAGEGLMIGIVSNFDWAINGTDKTISLTFEFRPQLRTHLYWISLPYTGSIKTASELVTSIAGGLGPGTDTKIISVGKWVYAMQWSEVFSYTPTGWSGTNFTIGPGDGIWIEVVSLFAWSPPLITPEIP